MSIEIHIEKLTQSQMANVVAGVTRNKQVNMSLKTLYKSEHSPIYTQLFVVLMRNIPIFSSTHFARHKVGVEHYVQSCREDRTNANKDVNRNTLVDHVMVINAQSLINMARKRLCYKASKKTRQIMEQIVDKMYYYDPDLWKFLVPNCVYRNGLCSEPVPCGNLKQNLENFKGYFEDFTVISED